jgi:hypothetical protein
MQKKASVGVIVFSIVFILLGVLSLLVMPLLSVLYMITGVWVLTLKPSARYLAITTSIFCMVLNTIRLIDYLNKGASFQIILALAITYFVYAGIIYFFTRPKVKEQFNMGTNLSEDK